MVGKDKMLEVKDCKSHQVVTDSFFQLTIKMRLLEGTEVGAMKRRIEL